MGAPWGEQGARQQGDTDKQAKHHSELAQKAGLSSQLLCCFEVHVVVPGQQHRSEFFVVQIDSKIYVDPETRLTSNS
jgi:hypothetical protein